MAVYDYETLAFECDACGFSVTVNAGVTVDEAREALGWTHRHGVDRCAKCSGTDPAEDSA